MSIGWGIIGCGELVDNVIAPAINDSKEGRLIGFSSRMQKKAENFAAKHGAMYGYSKVEDLLKNDKIDAVFVGTPPSLHYSSVIAAAQAKKHILCEKPMATNSQQCIEMIEVCEKNRVNLMIGYMLRFHHAHRQIKSLISNGAFGRIVLLRAQISFKYSGSEEGGWRMDPSLAGGGMIIEGGTHCIDLFQFLNGDIEEVFAFTDTLASNITVEDTAIVCVRFANRACGNFESCYNINMNSSRRYLEVYGDKGFVRAMGTISRYGEGKVEIFHNDKIETLSFPPQSMYLDEINEFNASIKEKRRPLINGIDGLRNLEIVEAIYQSSKKGTAEKIKHLI